MPATRPASRSRSWPLTTSWSRTATTVPSLPRNMADRSAWSSPNATHGRARSGSRGSNGSSETGSDSGSVTATTTPPIPGSKSATGRYTQDERGAFGTLRGGSLHQPFEPDLGNASGGMDTGTVDRPLVERDTPTDQFLKVETRGIEPIPAAERKGSARDVAWLWVAAFANFC